MGSHALLFSLFSVGLGVVHVFFPFSSLCFMDFASEALFFLLSSSEHVPTFFGAFCSTIGLRMLGFGFWGFELTKARRGLFLALGFAR